MRWRHKGLLLHLPAADTLSFEETTLPDTIPFVGPCWMDDLCVCLTADTNIALQSTLGVATGQLLDIFKSYAMTPNLQPGKTAVIISPRGPGTNKWKKSIFGPLADGNFLSLGEHHPYKVPVVTEYTHLGGKVHFSTKLRREIQNSARASPSGIQSSQEVALSQQTFPDG